MAISVSRRKAFKVEGLAELQKKIGELKDSVAYEEAYEVVGEAANEAVDIMKSSMEAQNWPKEAIESTFSYAKLSEKTKTAKATALAGIKKRGRNRPYAPGYAEWPKDKPEVGESLATMFEYGTSKMAPRPAIRKSITEIAAMAGTKLKSGFEKIILRHTKS